jgi:hypothetical protein
MLFPAESLLGESSRESSVMSQAIPLPIKNDSHVLKESGDTQPHTSQFEQKAAVLARFNNEALATLGFASSRIGALRSSGHLLAGYTVEQCTWGGFCCFPSESRTEGGRRQGREDR